MDFVVKLILFIVLGMLLSIGSMYFTIPAKLSLSPFFRKIFKGKLSPIKALFILLLFIFLFYSYIILWGKIF